MPILREMLKERGFNKVPKLKPSFKRKWIEALESGKYAQGKKRLRAGDAYCCLGVACDLHPSRVWYGEVDDVEDSNVSGEFGAIPPVLLSDIFPNCAEDCLNELQNILAELNDHQDFTFAEIAAEIGADL